MFGFHGEYPAVRPKAKFWRYLVKNCKKSAVKHSIENLFCRILWICLQPFVQDCLKTQVSISNSLQVPWFYIFWRFWYFRRLVLFSNWYLRQLRSKKYLNMIWIWYFSKNTILHFGVKYEFGTKRCSSCNRAVFKKRFYFNLLKTDHFWCFNALLNK